MISSRYELCDIKGDTYVIKQLFWSESSWLTTRSTNAFLPHCVLVVSALSIPLKLNVRLDGPCAPNGRDTHTGPSSMGLPHSPTTIVPRQLCQKMRLHAAVSPLSAWVRHNPVHSDQHRVQQDNPS